MLYINLRFTYLPTYTIIFGNDYNFLKVDFYKNKILISLLKSFLTVCRIFWNLKQFVFLYIT